MSMQIVKHLFKAWNRVVNVRDGGINGQKVLIQTRKNLVIRHKVFWENLQLIV